MDAAGRAEQLRASLSAALVDGLRIAAPETLDLPHGAVVGRGRPGWWINVCAGLATNGPISPETVQAVVRHHEDNGSVPQIDLFADAGEAAFEVLADAGFSLKEAETASHLVLPHTDLAAPDADVRELDAESRRDDHALTAFIATMERGFAGDDATRLPPDQVAEWRHVLRLPGTRCFVAAVDGETAGTGSMMTTPPPPGLPKIALLYAGSVRAAFRRRGLQRDLILARLAAARDDGCDAAVVMGDAGGPTDRNALRLGMTPLCTVLTLHRPAAGLVGA